MLNIGIQAIFKGTLGGIVVGTADGSGHFYSSHDMSTLPPCSFYGDVEAAAGGGFVVHFVGVGTFIGVAVGVFSGTFGGRGQF